MSGATAHSPAAQDRARCGLRALWVCALVHFVLAVLWGFGLARFDGPDEPEHAEMAHFLTEHRRWPVMGRDLGVHLLDETTHELVPTPAAAADGTRAWDLDPAHRYSVRMHYTQHSPVGYSLLALATSAGRAFGGDGLAAARMLSALCGALAVLGAGCAARRLVPQRPEVAFASAAFLAFLPQFVFAGSYANPDTAAFAAGAWALERLAAGATLGWSTRRAAAFGATCGVALLAKMTAVPVAGALGVAFAWTVLRGTPVRWGVLLAAPAALVLVVAPWAGWLIAHFGFPPRMVDPGFASFVASLPQDSLPHLEILDGRTAASRHGETWISLLAGPWGMTTLKSFLGRFGWMSRSLPAAGYLILAVAWGVGAAGAVRAIVRPSRVAAGSVALRVVLVCGVLAVLLQIAASLQFSLAFGYQPQGRYLLPAAGCMSVLAGVGIGGLFEGRAARVVAWALAASMFALCVLVTPLAVG